MQIGVNKMTILQIYLLIILIQLSPPWKLNLTDSQIENAKGFQEGRVDKISKEDKIFLDHLEQEYLEKKIINKQ